jgi:serine/threonine-protein kinase
MEKEMNEMEQRTFAAALVLVAVGTVATPVMAEPPPRFPAGAVWHQDVSQAPLHPDSASMINTLAGLGGFGYGRMQIDFGMHIVHASATAPLRNIVGYPSTSEYYAPDCEPIGTPMPVPADGAIEANPGLSCANASEDCHLLVVQGATLYEAYRANVTGTTGLQSQCLAVWKLDAIYPDSNRGDHCTSADAAGFPIAPLLFNADEVYAAMQVANGDLGHAIRFILPNARMASISGTTRLYVRPASHAGAPSGPEASVPYGSRLRLRPDFPVSLYSPAAQVILRTMQHYGIVLADGGTIALTAESDLFTTHSWSELGIDSRVFDQQVIGAPVRIQDFAVIDTGPRIVETYDCVRNPDPPGGGTPSISVADASISEGASGTQVLNFTISLSGTSTSPVTFDFATANGTAIAGSDYAAAVGAGSIAAGASSTSVGVIINGDTQVEPNETFQLNLANVISATVTDGQAVGTIINDDVSPPQLSIADVAVSEGRKGTKLATFTVRLSSPTPVPVSYSIATGNLTATAGSDYQAQALTGEVIPVGASSKGFSVTIHGDTLREPDETFSVTVSGVSGATVADGYAVGTITNDDRR